MDASAGCGQNLHAGQWQHRETDHRSLVIVHGTLSESQKRTLIDMSQRKRGWSARGETEGSMSNRKQS